MESMENQLDLNKLKQLIKKGISAIPKEEAANEAIMVIGDTGVGKSTVMNFLAGNKLIVKIQGLKPKLMVEGKSNILIGHEKYSETSIPTRTMIENLAFYDCPGFGDNKGEEYEISNSFFVQRLLDIYSRVKIVLMIDESHISETRADKLPRLIKNLLRSFTNFDDIKMGVILIINRADRDLGINNYVKEINKIIGLKNEKGFLFEEQEQEFLNYLVENGRVKLFKMPAKQDRDKVFVPTEFEADILPSIQASDFVKSKHILNIVSESAKIAIRDYIDNLTSKIDHKVEAIAANISNKAIKKFTEAGKKIPILLEIKQEVMDLAEDVKSQNGENILGIIKREIPNENISDFEEDFESVMFFKGIYDKTSTYFSNLINKSYSELSLVLNRMDGIIIKLQKEEEEELLKKQLLLRKKEICNQREREKLEIRNKIKEINELRCHIGEMSQSSHVMIQSLGDTLSFLDSLGQEFGHLREDAIKMKEASMDLRSEFDEFSQVHIHKQRI